MAVTGRGMNVVYNRLPLAQKESFYELFADAQSCFFTMEYVHGRNLRDVLMALVERDGQFPLDAAHESLLRQVRRRFRPGCRCPSRTSPGRFHSPWRRAPGHRSGSPTWFWRREPGS